jgi:UDP-N-acetylmuramate dehydrogenase
MIPAFVSEQVPLAQFTTLELGGPAQYFTQVDERVTLMAALQWARARGLPVTLLGGGSNVVVSDAGIAGLVLRMRTRGIQHALGAGETRVAVEAGEDWDAFVAGCVQQDLAGLECLSGIPGEVGATPIQNVGAYGQEVSTSIVRVEVLDRQTLQTSWFDTDACGFGYRSSRFKLEPARHVVLAVTFALRPGGAPTLAYPELTRALAADGGAPSLADVRRAVLALRSAKSMLLDPADENRRSAGSFFLNPIVSSQVADELARRAQRIGVLQQPAELPRYAQADGRVKLSAAWLIEHSGTRKGERVGAVGVSSRHALALVHHGGGSSAELLAFAREINRRVRTTFGIELQPEPQCLGFEPAIKP